MIAVRFGRGGDCPSTKGDAASRTGVTCGTGAADSSSGEAADGSTASGALGAATGLTVSRTGDAWDARPVGIGRPSDGPW